MRIADSVTEGSSLFLAEVKRLKTCVDAARSEPSTLIILDEILAGTNSLERHAGTLSVLSLLATTSATILVATHDLELAAASKSEKHPTRLLHFRETIDGEGTMTFDYQLREGPCPTTNALEILRQSGLYPAELGARP
jgi:DNA mismatch repair ATPase MutS